jgi:hypothetical protein
LLFSYDRAQPGQFFFLQEVVLFYQPCFDAIWAKVYFFAKQGSAFAKSEIAAGRLFV